MNSIDDLQSALDDTGYLAGRALSTVAFLAKTLNRPLFLEGEPGTGKTELAKALSTALDRPLLRLQCYEGLDAAGAVADWNFPAQMVALRRAEAEAAQPPDLYGDPFLIERPLLSALRSDPPAVLLIDEIDRADEPFEAFLLEALSDWQVTIPERGTIRAKVPPITILTSNRTREVHDALKRRCLYHWVDFPDAERELQIVARRVPDLPHDLSRQVVAFVQALRTEDLFKRPGVAEAIDWAKCLLALDVIALTPDVIADTVGAILKYQDDIAMLQDGAAARALAQAQAALDTDG